MELMVLVVKLERLVVLGYHLQFVIKQSYKMELDVIIIHPNVDIWVVKIVIQSRQEVTNCIIFASIMHLIA